jgi:hypothetical protein
MSIWNFTNNNLQLYKELTKIDSSVEDILTQIYNGINEYEPKIFSFWIEENLKPKVDTYLLRYVIPLYELLEKQNQKVVIDSLVIQLFSCITWRTYDNCVDSHVPIHKGHQTSLLASLFLFDFAKTNSGENILPIFEYHIRLMTEQSVIEKSSPISLDNIWKRCSIFLLAAEINQLDIEKIDLYKKYINYSGLAHDTHDFFSDIASKVNSLPVFWMRQLNPDEVLSVNTVRQLYSRARQEVEPLEKEFEAKKIEKKFPLINHFLKESWKTFHDE